MIKCNNLEGLLEDLKRGELAIFVGAGLSTLFPTCLPSWNRFKEMILESLVYSIGDLKEFRNLSKEKLLSLLINCRFKPEVMLEQLAKIDRDNMPSVLNILRYGHPNAFHRLLAKLAKRRLIRIFITTNFDSMLEEAFEIEGVNYTTLVSENDFRRFLIEGVKFYKNTKNKRLFDSDTYRLFATTPMVKLRKYLWTREEKIYYKAFR